MKQITATAKIHETARVRPQHIVYRATPLNCGAAVVLTSFDAHPIIVEMKSCVPTELGRIPVASVPHGWTSRWLDGTEMLDRK